MRPNRTHWLVMAVVAAMVWTATAVEAASGSAPSHRAFATEGMQYLGSEILERSIAPVPGVHTSAQYEVFALHHPGGAELDDTVRDRRMTMVVMLYPTDETLGLVAVGEAVPLIPLGYADVELGEHVTFDLHALDRIARQRLEDRPRDRSRYIGDDGNMSYGISAAGAAGYGVALVTFGGTIAGSDTRAVEPLSVADQHPDSRLLPLQEVAAGHAQTETDIPLPVLYEACLSNGYHQALLVKSATTKSPRSTFAIVKTLEGAAADTTFVDTSRAFHEVGLKIGGDGFASGAFVKTAFTNTVSASATVGPAQFKRIRGKWLWHRWNLRCASFGNTYETLAGYGEWRPDSWSGELEPFGGAKATGWNWACARRWKIHAPDNLAYTVQTSTESIFHGDVTAFGSSLGVKQGYERSSATTVAYRELNGTRYLCGDGAYPSLAGKAKSSRTGP